MILSGLLHLSWWLLRWGSVGVQPFLAGLLYVPVFLAAAVCGFQAARHTTGRERAAWLCLGLGVLSWGVAQAIYTYVQAVLKISPFPSLADAFFLMCPPLVGAALVLLPHGSLSRAAWLRVTLEVGIMTAAATVFSWRYLLAALVESYDDQPLTGAIALAYPASDLLLLCLTLLLLSRWQRSRGLMTALLAAALLSFIVADTGFAKLSATSSYLPGNVIDLFWSLGGLLFGLAAVARQVHRAADELPAQPARPNTWTAYGPYLAVVACYLLLLQMFGGSSVNVVARGVLWGTALVLLLVMIRQAAALRENRRLNTALSQATLDLEHRVEVRTSELFTANSALQALSEDLEHKVRLRTAELELSQARLAHQAQHDGLTGLPNRTLFDDRLGRAVASAARHGRTLAVIYIDLDGFKLINDTRGYEVGDQVLETVARRFQAQVRHSDTVARMGGDEFTILLTEVEDLAAVATVARRVLEAAAQMIDTGDVSVGVSASIGIALYPADALDAAALKRQADAAMYRAKESGKNTICFYAAEMNSADQVRLNLADRLRRAVAQQEFQVVYQPQFAAGTQTLTSFEALLRWVPSGLGPVPPSEFIPIAEEYGLIAEIGAWVLNEVCRQQAAWMHSGLHPVMVAVNVSPLQFERPEFVEELRRTLGQHGLEGRWLELELTERIMLRDIALTAHKMAEVRALGASISIDDFGAGKTALSYLLQLPVSSVKIDRSLVQGLGSIPQTIRVVQAIVALAHALNLSVVAEGVETRAQLSGAVDLQCERVQGFLLGMPESSDEAGVRLGMQRPEQIDGSGR